MNEHVDINQAAACAGEYTDEAFWTKVKNCARDIGKTLVEKALLLYYVMKDPDTPIWAKTAIIAALAYLICPLDTIPDVFPIIGYSDDAAVIAAVIALVQAYLKEEHRRQARAKVNSWFG